MGGCSHSLKRVDDYVISNSGITNLIRSIIVNVVVEQIHPTLIQEMRVTELIRFPNAKIGLFRDGSPSHRVEGLCHIVR